MTLATTIAEAVAIETVDMSTIPDTYEGIANLVQL
jgi:hypothetical protein